MMLGYIHNTTKIRRIWDLDSGRNGRAVECSIVVFQEENAHGKSTKEGIEEIVISRTAKKLHDEIHEVEDMNMMEMNYSSRLQDSKSRPHKSVVTSELAL
jgi:hypothetical protein